MGGKLVPLDYELRTGDAVDILTSKAQGEGPSQDWLQFVATPRARNKIRQWFARGAARTRWSTARTPLQRLMRKQNLPIKRLATEDVLTQVAEEMKYPDLEALYVALGEGHVSPQSVVARITRSVSETSGGGRHRGPARPPRADRSADVGKGVVVKGLPDVWVRLGRAARRSRATRSWGSSPGAGRVVHRTDCPNVDSLEQEPERMIEVTWAEGKPTTFTVAIQVEALDRTRLLSDVATVLSDSHVNILSANSATGRTASPGCGSPSRWPTSHTSRACSPP